MHWWSGPGWNQGQSSRRACSFVRLNRSNCWQDLLCSVELGSIKCNLEAAKIRRKTWQLQSRNCQNWNSHTSIIGYLLPVCHRNNSWLYSQPHFTAACKVLWYRVKNCMRNPLRTNKTDNEICTSLKSKLYFLFLWLPTTMSTLISFNSGRIFATIRGKICPPQSRNCQNRFCTSLKSISISGFLDTGDKVNAENIMPSPTRHCRVANG